MPTSPILINSFRSRKSLLNHYADIPDVYTIYISILLVLEFFAPFGSESGPHSSTKGESTFSIPESRRPPIPYEPCMYQSGWSVWEKESSPIYTLIAVVAYNGQTADDDDGRKAKISHFDFPAAAATPRNRFTRPALYCALIGSKHHNAPRTHILHTRRQNAFVRITSKRQIYTYIKEFLCPESMITVGRGNGATLRLSSRYFFLIVCVYGWTLIGARLSVKLLLRLGFGV
jgi:hypothetical protein